MTNQPKEMTLDELLAHARSVDDSTARAKEEARLDKLGVTPRDQMHPAGAKRITRPLGSALQPKRQEERKPRSSPQNLHSKCQTMSGKQNSQSAGFS